LEKTNKQLKGPDKKPLNVVGSFQSEIEKINGSEKCIEEIFVLQGDSAALLSGEASHKLKLVHFNMDNINMENVQDEFPTLFQGLSKLSGQYNINIDSKGAGCN
jgi:hypothetical protein